VPTRRTACSSAIIRTVSCAWRSRRDADITEPFARLARRSGRVAEKLIVPRQTVAHVIGSPRKRRPTPDRLAMISLMTQSCRPRVEWPVVPPREAKPSSHGAEDADHLFPLPTTRAGGRVVFDLTTAAVSVANS
jgi:hypothetical protein